MNEIRIDPADARPLWRQIEEGVAALVASGSLAPGAAVASVRELARELQVNPATVAKAYRRLADAGVLAVRRGEGTFVADAPPSTSPAELEERLERSALRYASEASTLGADRARATGAVEAAFDVLAAPRPASREPQESGESHE